MSYEYRVSWQREGRDHRSAIYQTEKAARAKAQRLVDIDEMLRDGELPPALEHLYGSYDHMNGESEALPPLLERPRVEAREVGEWVIA